MSDLPEKAIWDDGWGTGYRRGYGHGLKDLLSLAFILIEKEQAQTESSGVTEGPLERLQTKLAEKYNELTKDAG
jgi:hypothetical protein